MRQCERKSDAVIGKFPTRPELSPSLLIFCGQILSIQYFSQIKMDQPPHKSLIPEILHVRSGIFFNLDTSIFGRRTEPASLQSHEIYFDRKSTEGASRRHPAADAGSELRRCRHLGSDGLIQSVTLTSAWRDWSVTTHYSECRECLRSVMSIPTIGP